ncbi:hypothetical protein G6F68_016938 [Rhizopus microsporus]|nr:hypothetical protein G6F68_016938 [Rhizopus microsporus]
MASRWDHPVWPALQRPAQSMLPSSGHTHEPCSRSRIWARLCSTSRLPSRNTGTNAPPAACSGVCWSCSTYPVAVSSTRSRPLAERFTPESVTGSFTSSWGSPLTSAYVAFNAQPKVSRVRY